MSLRRILFSLCILFLAKPLLAGSVLGDDLNEDDLHDYVSLPKLRVSAEWGYSNWLFKPDSITSSYEKYLDRLSQGISNSADLAYFFWPKGAIGVNWIWFVSRARGGGFAKQLNNPVVHDVHERVSVFYYGPDFITRQHLTTNLLLLGGFGAGYLDFTNTGIDNGVTYRITAQNFALQAHLNVEYSLWRTLALGCSGRLVFSNLREYTYNGTKVRITNPDNQFLWRNIPLYRLEMVAGIHFLY